MAGCARAAPPLLLHTSLLLALVAGAGLATAARLKWDPSTYIAARELFPAEYRVAAVMLCAASCALLALGHLAALALAAPPRARRALLITHAALMGVLVCAEAAWLAWTGARVAAWLRSAQAAQAAELLEVRDHLEPLLNFLARWHPLPGRIQDLIREAEADAPRNLYVAGAALALAALQPAAALLALLAARAPPPALPPAPAPLPAPGWDSAEHAPLRAAYKGGKLVLV